MKYTDNEVWQDNIDIIDEAERVLGGIDGPTNRPIKQLANRTAWLKKQLTEFKEWKDTRRIPVYEDITLNVTTAGSDVTGDLTHPFRQPQAAFDWAGANLDFRLKRKLRIQCGEGQFNGIDFRVLPVGVSLIEFTGTGANGNTKVEYVSSHCAREIVVSNMTMTGYDPDSSGQIVTYNNATILLSGSITFQGIASRQVTHIMACNVSFIQTTGVTLQIKNGYVISSLIYAHINATILLRGATFMIDELVTTSMAAISASRGGIVIIENTVFNRPTYGRTFYADQCARIISGGRQAYFPGSEVGYVDASSTVI